MSADLIDFYQSWVIELIPDEEGYRSVCYSASRKRLHSHQTYREPFQAIRAAKQLISQYEACSQLSLLVRDWYEEDQVSLDEWRSLNASLFDRVIDLPTE